MTATARTDATPTPPGPGSRPAPAAAPAPYARPNVVAVAVTLALLIGGLAPTEGRGLARDALRSLHAIEPNRADHDKAATGYYVGLIDGDGSGRDELALALLGKPPERKFGDIGATRFLPGGYLQFELLPDVDVEAFGGRFTTNAQGLRDRPYEVSKPPGVFRIALLGSSMDMGWGVGVDETYENRLEEWLNAHAAKRGLDRRFEVLNFAVAAYGPLHRVEVFEQRVRAFQPDLVLYSATRLDTRLLQIHLVGLLQGGIDLKYDFARQVLAAAGIDPAAEAVAPAAAADGDGKARKDRLKVAVEPLLWDLNAAAIGHLAGACRSAGIGLAMVIIPRATEADGPASRGPDVARIRAIGAGQGVPVADLTASFDDQDRRHVEIAPWDDHPNALGHRLLFLELGRSIVADAPLYRLLFDAEPPPSDAPGLGPAAADRTGPKG